MAKILVVDDDATFRKLVQSRLEFSGYEVITAYDGIDGLDKAQNEKPDLILMDIMMPRMTGGDAVRESFKHKVAQSLICQQELTP